MASNPSFTKKSTLVTFRCPNEVFEQFEKAAGKGTNKTKWLLEAIQTKLFWEHRILQSQKPQEDYPFPLSSNKKVSESQRECGLLILDMKQDSMTSNQIAKKLNALKLKTPTGNNWNKNTVSIFYSRYLQTV